MFFPGAFEISCNHRHPVVPLLSRVENGVVLLVIYAVIAVSLTMFCVYGGAMWEEVLPLTQEYATTTYLVALTAWWGWMWSIMFGSHPIDVGYLPRARNGFHLAAVILTIGCATCFGIFGRVDNMAWSIVLVAVQCLAFATLVQRRRHAGREMARLGCTSLLPRHQREGKRRKPHGSPLLDSCDEGSESARVQPRCGDGCRRYHLQDCDGTGCAQVAAGCCSCCHVASYVVALVVLALLLNGSIWEAHWRTKYSPRGTFAELSVLSSGKSQRILVHCEGPKNASFPVYVLDADQSHGAADFWPLQRNLTAAGRRSCTWDKPSLGYSDPWYKKQHLDVNTVYPQLFSWLDAHGEGSRFIFVGWGGGGANAYAFAKHSPDRVAAMAFLMTYGDNFEWRQPAYVNGWSDEKLNAYKDQDLIGRRVVFAGIRGALVPLGLMTAVMPFQDPDPYGENGYAWPERFNEYHYNYVLPMTWAGQWFALLPSFDTHITRDDRGIFSQQASQLMGMPTMQLITNHTLARVCRGVGEASLQNGACADAWKGYQYGLDDLLTVANVTGNAYPVYVNTDNHDLGIPLSGPQLVVDALMDMWPLDGTGPIWEANR